MIPAESSIHHRGRGASPFWELVEDLPGLLALYGPREITLKREPSPAARRLLERGLGVAVTIGQAPYRHARDGQTRHQRHA